MFRKHVLPWIVYFFYTTLHRTWRIQVIESASLKRALSESKPMVYAHWHGDELGIVYLLKPYRSAAIVSTSRDGELMDSVIRKLGARTSRGSSTRGGVSALRGILRLAKEGWRPSVAVDGPKGPLHKVKPGVFEISKIIGGEIFPLTVACDSKFVFKKSWNKSFLPLPFARLVVVWGESLPAVARETDAHDPNLALRLEEALANAGQQARNIIAAPKN
jgi:lysophospholipid acyltransferase (LPLAT)-like uncharacterized protein